MPRCLPPSGDVLLAHRPLLQSIARRLVPRPDTDDLVQETLLRALKVDCLPREPGRLRSYLAVIARNVGTDWHRRARHRRAESLQEEEMPSPERVIDDWLTQDELDSVLRSLRPDQRSLLTEFHLRGTPLREIADRLGLSVNAVAQRLHRVRALARAGRPETAN